MEEQGIRENLRQRSSRRLRHEAQAKVFRDQKGNLDVIRKSLGLRPSQICEILKVHPSAWTRWVKNEKAPPHVYQMMEWYLELLQWRGQKHPFLNAPEEQIKVLRQEDPKTYAPILSHDFIESGPSVKKNKGQTIQKILVLVWCIQTILWCIVLTVLLRQK